MNQQTLKVITLIAFTLDFYMAWAKYLFFQIQMSEIMYLISPILFAAVLKSY